jgi:FtsZ-binding cell division protein ZapB
MTSEETINDLRAKLIEKTYLFSMLQAENEQLRRDKLELAEACDNMRIERDRLYVEEQSLRADLMTLQRHFYDGAF